MHFLLVFDDFHRQTTCLVISGVPLRAEADFRLTMSEVEATAEEANWSVADPTRIVASLMPSLSLSRLFLSLVPRENLEEIPKFPPMVNCFLTFTFFSQISFFLFFLFFYLFFFFS